VYENLKYNFDVEDWAATRAAELRLAGRDPKLLISRDMDGDWVIVGLKVDGKIEFAPESTTAAWMKRLGIGAGREDAS
jgi:hypothetical protein